MHRRVGAAGAHGADAPRRVVEEHRRFHRAPPKGIEAAPVERLAAIALVNDFSVAEIRPHAGRLVWLHRRAAHSIPEPTADRQRLVADGLRGHAMARASCDEAVLRVALEQLRRHRRGLPVRRAGDDEAVQVLHVPAGLHELGREPVEQPEVLRPFALHAEILGGLDEADPEEMLPVTVHGDAGGERVIGIGQPLREVEPVGAALGQAGEAGRDAWLDGLAFVRLVVHAPDEQEGVTRLVHVAHDHGAAERVVEFFDRRAGGFPAALGRDEVRHERTMMPGERVALLGQALGRGRVENLGDFLRQAVAHLN